MSTKIMVKLNYHNNGFDYVKVFDNGKQKDLFVPYHSIKKISRVQMEDWTDRYWSLLVSGEIIDLFIKKPAFAIYLFDEFYPLYVYDDRYIVTHDPWRDVTEQDVKNSFWLRLKSVFGVKRTRETKFNFDEWLSDNSECVDGFEYIKEIREELLNHFNNWRLCGTDRPKSGGII